ncbi:hypothetical protein B0H19DRAFT_1078936 [Mycena capillaripes]|nr:hypothetical protein B0H19DRAFT_1078936 [Mycena capillaripes]
MDREWLLPGDPLLRGSNASNMERWEQLTDLTTKSVKREISECVAGLWSGTEEVDPQERFLMDRAKITCEDSGRVVDKENSGKSGSRPLYMPFQCFRPSLYPILMRRQGPEGRLPALSRPGGTWKDARDTPLILRKQDARRNGGTWASFSESAPVERTRVGRPLAQWRHGRTRGSRVFANKIRPDWSTLEVEEGLSGGHEQLHSEPNAEPA